MNNSSGNMVTGCLLTNNFRGIDVSGNDNYIAGNILSDNDESGIVVGGSGNHIVDNAIYSSGDYGIWLCYATNTSIVNNIIDNVDTGVRLACNSSNNIISSNTVSNCFHSMSDASSETNVITNNLITQGYSYDGIILYSSSPKIVNNTIANNENSAIYCLYSSNPEIVNNIVTGNRRFGIFADESSAPVITFSDVWGNATNYSGIADQTGVNGNISEDPMFVHSAAGDYYLQAGSPCIDAGTNDAPKLPDKDFEGNPRIIDGDNDNIATVDMGADEHEPSYLEILLEIKPGSYTNSINLKSRGVVPVAVLTTDDFDAYDVNPNSCVFASAEPESWTMEDVEIDGDYDMLFHFRTQDLDLNQNSTEASLKGETVYGIQFVGTDSVNIVPKGKKYAKKGGKDR